MNFCTSFFDGSIERIRILLSFSNSKLMTRNVRVRVPPPPGVTLIPEFITEKEEEVN